MNPTKTMKRCVSFSPMVKIEYSFSSEEYDRSSCKMSRLSFQDIIEVMNLKREYQKALSQLEAMKLSSESQSQFL